MTDVHFKGGSKKTRSKASSTSTRSRSSSASMAIALARAEAQAAKAEAAFAKKEIELKIKQAHLKASLESLQLEKRAAAAEAKADALETVMEQVDRSSYNKIELPTEDPVRRTNEYIEEHAVFIDALTMPVLSGPYIDDPYNSHSAPQHESIVDFIPQNNKEENEFTELDPVLQGASLSERYFLPIESAACSTGIPVANEDFTQQTSISNFYLPKVLQKPHVTDQAPLNGYNNSATHRLANKNNTQPQATGHKISSGTSR
ncbi:uncharacterized protein LOC120542802 [Polypterus senegalus]|uniref:uncharacterized protein LOC120542802 n=1 Tax=Polypterus senegalus TaxID=55291 RepID=UPI0019661A4F|nr:uncharacterized protein LOC120542802 [Polypterus senegalus]